MSRDSAIVSRSAPAGPAGLGSPVLKQMFPTYSPAM